MNMKPVKPEDEFTPEQLEAQADIFLMKHNAEKKENSAEKYEDNCDEREKKPCTPEARIQQLIDKGKKNGSLTVKEILEVIEELHLDPEAADKLFETVDNAGIETVDEEFNALINRRPAADDLPDEADLEELADIEEIPRRRLQPPTRWRNPSALTTLSECI
jgi:hypothetical protein